MNLVFSRKGFDSGTGRVASPILPSGELWSLPIPDASSRTSYRDIVRGDRSLGTLVAHLTRGRIAPTRHAHLDPDLHAGDVPRMDGWKPLFGQMGAAESHLQTMGVGPGDLFVFYGWFRQVEYIDGVYRYAKGVPDFHVIFGWLQVEQRIPVENRSTVPPWALDHPHCTRRLSSANNSLYSATACLSLPGVPAGMPGAGLLRQFHPLLCLTAPGLSRSVWRLPAWFYPAAGRRALSYHASPDRWQCRGGSVLLHTVGRGQEFVLDCRAYPEAVGWLASLFCSAYRAE